MIRTRFSISGVPRISSIKPIITFLWMLTAVITSPNTASTVPGRMEYIQAATIPTADRKSVV